MMATTLRREKCETHMTDEQKKGHTPFTDPKRKGRNITINIPDQVYVELLIKLRNEGISWKRFFAFIIEGFAEDNPGIMDYMDSKIADRRSKKRTKILKKERKLIEETISVFGLDKNEIEDIYDILEEEFDP